MEVEALEEMREALGDGEAVDEAVEVEELEALELLHLRRGLEPGVGVGVCLEAEEKEVLLPQRRRRP